MRNRFFMLISLSLFPLCLMAKREGDSSLRRLQTVFCHPQDSCRTKVWWFHGETETTKQGITADLEAFKRAGVGGVVYYDQVHGKGKGAFPVMSKPWWRMFKYSAAEAHRLGLSFEANISDGYVAGGPWITLDYAMKRIMATETLVKGGKTTSLLPVPESKLGFKQVAVLAVPLKSHRYQTNHMRRPTLSHTLLPFPVDSLFAEKKSFCPIPYPGKGKEVQVVMDYGTPFLASSITYQIKGRGKSATISMNVPSIPSATFTGDGYQPLPDIGELWASEDGFHYKKVCQLKPGYSTNPGGWHQHTMSFLPVKARYFSLVFHDWTLDNDKNKNLYIGNITLSSMPKMNLWEEKCGEYSEYTTYGDTPSYTSSDVIDPSEVIDVTSKVDADGRLTWKAPGGEWLILRFCQVPTGAVTKHARVDFKGLECDKLSARAAEWHWKNFVQPMMDTLRQAGTPLQGLIMDSHEAGPENWTEGFDTAFQTRRGYDLHRYLPALAGYVVGSVAETEVFYNDMRRTIADMMADNYFGTFDRLCRKNGLVLTAQASGNAQNIVSDNFQAKGRVEKPQGEFWAKHIHGSYDMKESSSAAHVYGKPIASAEAYTDARYSNSLADLKNLADFAYCFGLNEFVVCASAYQPWLDKCPGSTANGRQYCLNRNNTYWNYSRPFWDYQARCAAMMRQGRPVVDLCVYAGDDTPMTVLASRLPQVPEGYDFDVCTTDGLMSRMTVKDGQITLPDSMRYRMLVLEHGARVPYKTLQRIADMVEQGMAVYGERPIMASRTDLSEQKVYETLADRLWPSLEKCGVVNYGKGRVYSRGSLSLALKREGLRPDMLIKSGNRPDNKVYFAHRTLPETDIYFVFNHSEAPYDTLTTLRTPCKYLQRWNPVTGERFQLKTSIQDGGLSTRLTLRPSESCFLIATDCSADSLKYYSWAEHPDVYKIPGAWTIDYDTQKGGPGKVRTMFLQDWTQSKDEGIKYYSGSAVYENVFKMPAKQLFQQVSVRCHIPNGLAVLAVNGHEVGTLWCNPYELDITPYVKKGQNKIRLEVVNSLYNRMIGDAVHPDKKQYTQAIPPIVTADTPLVPSGIVGDVELLMR